MTGTTIPDELTTSEGDKTLADKASAAYATTKETVVDAAARSRDAVADAARSTAETVKAHPGATAAIVAGAAAAIAGAAFGASKLIEKRKDATPPPTSTAPKPPKTPK